MVKIKMANYIPVNVGDFVAAYFDHTNTTAEGVVIKVETRKYTGRVNDGTIGVSPLVTILTEEKEFIPIDKCPLMKTDTSVKKMI